MSTPLESLPLWNRTLAPQNDANDPQREMLRQAFLDFRERVQQLASSISSELPGLTIHDITHIDALWRVADEIAGPEYPLNPAESFVLGGTFLLHDAAHVMAAYEGGIDEIKETTHWADLIAQRYSSPPPKGSKEEKEAIFQVLRHLHAEQAQKLPYIKWKIPGTTDEIHLLEHTNSRNYYGDLIGEIASSHHWSPQQVADTFKDRIISPPGFLQSTNWSVDAMKIAFLLRVADAAHIDGLRAPWFLFALNKPTGISEAHWRFQAKMGQVTRNSHNELSICAGAPFLPEERQAWWLAFDTARMIDRELSSAHMLMQEGGCETFAVRKVCNIEAPESFSRQVRVRGWEPVNVGPTVGDLPKLIGALGGSALYGDDSTIPIRELLQNAIDATQALRKLNTLPEQYGEITVSVSHENDNAWKLEIEDNGIGMSRYVLTRVLLDFGGSLWSSDALREELPGLAKSGFTAGGQFGIGFYSVFMISDEIKITTRRFERSKEDKAEQWQLIFDKGLNGRPLLSTPTTNEKIKTCGTKISIKIESKKLLETLQKNSRRSIFRHTPEKARSTDEEILFHGEELLRHLVTYLCPNSNVTLKTKFNDIESTVNTPSDWKKIPYKALLKRTNSEEQELYNLKSDEGEIIGRLTLGGSIYSIFSDPAAITVNGIRCGSSTGLSGVVIAKENNHDARRFNARPAGNLSNWNHWAHDLISKEKKLSKLQYLRLHPVAPEIDLPVWILNGRLTSLEKICELINENHELMIHDGDITHEDEDDMSSSRFDEFDPISDLICIPSYGSNYTTQDKRINSKEFPWNIDALPISYWRLFEEKLLEKWGNFESEELDNFIVGEAGGQEIRRSVWVYYRVPAEE